MQKIWKATIVGASSLQGKELAEALGSSERRAWDLKLVDGAVRLNDDTGVRITSAGDEAAIVQPLTADALVGSDVVFFAEDAATALKQWRAVAGTGAAVVDMTGALGAEQGVATRAPGLGAAHGGGERVVESAHPAAVMLATLAMALRSQWPDAELAATVMLPAAEYGQMGLDALQQQSAALLTFQPVSDDLFGGQSAFNLYAQAWEEATVRPESVAERMRRELQSLLGAEHAAAVRVQGVQAPVFYGYAASVFVRVDASADDLAKALESDRVQVVRLPESCSTRTAPEDGRIAVTPGEQGDGGVWLWCVCDGLKVAAQNAIACAMELLG